ncbi:MAG: aminoacyl-histidine dipeptidase, partial [Turicibacter sp.]|nr:aminoacyl-histidine dipeptidase [Turicibacter sp.]
MKSCLDYFKEICAIPHGSGNEKALSDYVCQYAKRLNLDYFQDEYSNVIIKKPATKEAVKTSAVILQGHLDMVCEKLGTCEHNFETDPIPYYIEDRIMRTKGTTLGADDGIAISYMLRLLEATDVIHPDLECVFTTGEEVGLCGAVEFDMNHLKGRHLINLDAGPEGCMLVGSAGGGGVLISCPIK